MSWGNHECQKTVFSRNLQYIDGTDSGLLRGILDIVFTGHGQIELQDPQSVSRKELSLALYRIAVRGAVSPVSPAGNLAPLTGKSSEDIVCGFRFADKYLEARVFNAPPKRDFPLSQNVKIPVTESLELVGGWIFEGESVFGVIVESFVLSGRRG